jgi:hypothetical protein
MGVIGDVMNRLTPAGAVPTHEADNVTGELNPFMETTVIVAEPLPPCVNMILEIEVSEKSATAVVELVLFVVVAVVVWLVNGTVTVKVAETESPLGLPVAVTVLEPAVTFVTIKEPDNLPLEIEQLGELTTLPDNEQLVSLVRKPEPDT